MDALVTVAVTLVAAIVAFILSFRHGKNIAEARMREESRKQYDEMKRGMDDAQNEFDSHDAGWHDVLERMRRDREDER